MTARAWTAFAAISLLWGVPYLFIKVAVDDGVPPAFVAFSRVVLAAAILVPLAMHAGGLGSLRGRWRWLALFALFEVVIPFPLIAAGERHVDSSVAAIVIATAPLIVALLALRFDDSERVTGLRLGGLVIGFAGVIALVGLDIAGRPDELVGVAAILVAAVGYAIGPMILKRKMADLDPRATMGVSLAIAAVMLLPLAAVDPPTEMPSQDALIALIVLGLFCTAIAFVVYSALVSEVGAGRALVITYVNPVVALGLGVVVLGEKPGVGALAGLLLIIAGSWLSTDGRLPPGLERVGRRLRPSRPAPARRDPLQPLARARGR
jgi:drug/metabolite transporter (DMT)-like permease